MCLARSSRARESKQPKQPKPPKEPKPGTKADAKTSPNAADCQVPCADLSEGISSSARDADAVLGPAQKRLALSRPFSPLLALTFAAELPHCLQKSVPLISTKICLGSQIGGGFTSSEVGKF